jgi:hypothetical protein
MVLFPAPDGPSMAMMICLGGWRMKFAPVAQNGSGDPDAQVDSNASG